MYQPEINPESHLTQRLIAEGRFQQSPLRIVDAGARHGVAAHWGRYGDQIEIVAFEPDADECRRLADVEPSAARRYVPVGLSATEGEVSLNVASYADSSSMFANNEPFLARFAMGDRLAQVSTTTIQVTDVDSFAQREGMSYVDFMKVDVEGAELLVLRGAERMLSTAVLGVSVEVWFQEEHLGRPLFATIDGYLRQFGFALFDLRNINRWRRQTHATRDLASAVGSGQLMYADALYFKDLPGMPTGRQTSDLELLKLASLAELFCYQDFAIEVLQLSPALAYDGAGNASRLVRELQRQTAPSDERWKAATRTLVRRTVPPAARRRLMRLLQSLVAE